MAKKVWAALDAGLLPIMCVGETEDEREAGSTEDVLGSQVLAGLAVRARRGGGARSPSPTNPSGPSGPARPLLPRSPRRPLPSCASQVARVLGAKAG